MTRALRFVAVAALATALPPLAVPAAASATAPAQSVGGSTAHPYAVHVADAAARFGIPEPWIWAVMRVESRGNPRAISAAGAMGLMQIMPRTWTDLRTRHGLGTDPFDVRDNIMAGAAYLRAMHDRYGNMTAMLAAYNAGPGRYDDHLARGRPLPAETIAYLAQFAPLIGDVPAGQVAAVAPTPDPLAWRRAALFARTTSDDTGRGAPSTSDTSVSTGAVADASGSAPPDRTVADAITAVQPPEAQADELFVRRTNTARPQ